MDKPRRNYIRRKRCFNDCVDLIMKTLRIIKQARGEPVSEDEIRNAALCRARQIEAACWTPRSKMSDESYKKLTMLKTTELCTAILRQNLKNIDQVRLKIVALIGHKDEMPPTSYVPRAPIQLPIFDRPQRQEPVFPTVDVREVCPRDDRTFSSWAETEEISLGDGLDCFCSEQLSF